MIGVILGIDGISSAIIHIQYLHHFVHSDVESVCAAGASTCGTVLQPLEIRLEQQVADFGLKYFFLNMRENPS